MEDLAKKLIKYFKTLGIDVYTNTKARGHQGFYLKGRIDVSKNTKDERLIPTLLHEFTHFIHEKIEKDMAKTGGSFEKIFDVENSETLEKDGKNRDNSWLFSLPLFSRGEQKDLLVSLLDLSVLQKELLDVTNFVDENSLHTKLKKHKDGVKEKIKFYENIIKQYYPDFKRSEKFRDFDKYIKKSKARYLLSYDMVKFVSRFLKRVEILSIEFLERDFPDMHPAFCAYIRLRSSQRKQAKISRRINHLKKYYCKPTELFSRLVEGLYIDSKKTQTLAPTACKRFFELLEEGYYFELKEVFQLISGRKIETTEFSPKYLFAQS